MITGSGCFIGDGNTYTGYGVGYSPFKESGSFGALLGSPLYTIDVAGSATFARSDNRYLMIDFFGRNPLYIAYSSRINNPDDLELANSCVEFDTPSGGYLSVYIESNNIVFRRGGTTEAVATGLDDTGLDLIVEHRITNIAGDYYVNRTIIQYGSEKYELEPALANTWPIVPNGIYFRTYETCDATLNFMYSYGNGFEEDCLRDIDFDASVREGTGVLRTVFSPEVVGL